MTFHITKKRDKYYVDGLEFDNEAQAANMCMRMAEDAGKLPTIYYPYTR